MAVYVAIEQVGKTFPLAGGKEYIALKGIDLEIRRGEFVSLIGHSGCGKSTLLNLIAGLESATEGVVVLEGQYIRKPSPERMVVFQNYSLLPWLTVRDNVALAVDEVLGKLPAKEREDLIRHYIHLVGLDHALDKFPAQLSGGMKQRVAIARALAVRPKLLLLDEPFGALDALTRGNLQEKLVAICEQTQTTAVMVTHDVDEAVFMSDRIVMLTNGPASNIGGILTVDIPRPRYRLEVIKHPSYYSLRSEILYFLNQQKRVKKLRARKVAVVSRHGLEKVNLEIGFVPLTACAPLAVAKEKGFFQKHGLDEVNLVRETSWRGIADGLQYGYLDGAQMPSGMPMWLTLGGMGKNLTTVTALTMTRNGNAITLSRRLYEKGVYSLGDFARYLKETPEKPCMGVVHPASMHNLLLRYWLASGGIDPDRDVELKIIPPAQMVADLKAGSIDGFCVGEPWNFRAAYEGVGFTVATDREIWDGHPGKVLGVREDWAIAYPNTHIALVKALLEACVYCADPRHTEEIRELIARKEYVGTKKEYIHLGSPELNTCNLETPMREYAHHQFFGATVNRPSRTEHLWLAAQMVRWGEVPFPRNWVEVAERVCQVGVFSTAAREIGLSEITYSKGAIHLFDGVSFSADNPIEYLHTLHIERNFTLAEIPLTAG